MFLHKTLSESSVGKTDNTVFTLSWESRALRPREGSSRRLLRPTLSAARVGEVVGDVLWQTYVKVFVHECLLVGFASDNAVEVQIDFAVDHTAHSFDQTAWFVL